MKKKSFLKNRNFSILKPYKTDGQIFKNSLRVMTNKLCDDN